MSDRFYILAFAVQHQGRMWRCTEWRLSSDGFWLFTFSYGEASQTIAIPATEPDINAALILQLRKMKETF